MNKYKKIWLGIAGIIFLGSLSVSSFADETVKFWKNWERGVSLEFFPECGLNVHGIGGDDILQATVDTYCGVKPGGYVAYINPKVMDIYKSRGAIYPDGKTGVLVFEKIGVAFTTDHKNGKPIYDVISLDTGKSVASKEAKHPLNPKTCEDCHASFKGVCVGYVCGNRY